MFVYIGGHINTQAHMQVRTPTLINIKFLPLTKVMIHTHTHTHTRTHTHTHTVHTVKQTDKSARTKTAHTLTCTQTHKHAHPRAHSHRHTQGFLVAGCDLPVRLNVSRAMMTPQAVASVECAYCFFCHVFLTFSL